MFKTENVLFRLTSFGYFAIAAIRIHKFVNVMYNSFMARIQMSLQFVNFKKLSYLLPFS